MKFLDSYNAIFISGSVILQQMFCELICLSVVSRDGLIMVLVINLKIP
jgi:hypothetical protein